MCVGELQDDNVSLVHVCFTHTLLLSIFPFAPLTCTNDLLSIFIVCLQCNLITLYTFGNMITVSLPLFVYLSGSLSGSLSLPDCWLHMVRGLHVL